jgi:hypothetical protein
MNDSPRLSKTRASYDVSPHPRQNRETYGVSWRDLAIRGDVGFGDPGAGTPWHSERLTA